MDVQKNSTSLATGTIWVTLDDGTTIEGETEATVLDGGGETRVRFGECSGVLQDNQIRVEVKEQRESVLYQVKGSIQPQNTGRLAGQLTIKETHPDGEVVNTRVDLEAWR